MYYPSQIYRCHKNGKYDVYFLDDGLTKRGVHPKAIRLPRGKPKWARIRRKDLINMEFDHIDPTYPNTPTQQGRYKVLKLGEGRHMNKYLCTAKGLPAGLYFDVGYVQKRLIKHIFPIE